MNTKLITYEEALKRLKALEVEQRMLKGRRGLATRTRANQNADYYNELLHKNKKNVNVMLSLVITHKQARKLYGKLLDKEKK